MRWIMISLIELVLTYALITFAIVGQLRAQEVDPTGFTQELNLLRTQRGLPAVRYDPGIVGHAARNNSLQSVYGLGHHWLGGLAQCAGLGQPDMRSVLNAWNGSPGHAAILLSPSLVSVGYHQSGVCHTVACSMGWTVSAPVQSVPQMVPHVMPCYPVRRRWCLRLCR